MAQQHQNGIRILIAPNAYKGTLSASDAALAIDQGLAGFRCRRVPMADGGDGTRAVLTSGGGWTRHCADARNACGTTIQVPFSQDDKGTAVIESAEVIGLGVSPGSRPDLADSRGLGQIMQAALDSGARHLVIGLGGSAVVDAGAGMLATLGVELFNARDQVVLSPAQGRPVRVAGALDARLKEVRLTVLFDVESPLLGHSGARLYMPQKGVASDDLDACEEHLKACAGALEHWCGRNLRDRVGSGAAGGLAMAFAALGAELRGGAAFVAERSGLRAAIEDSDWVISGEGRLDEQTGQDKAVNLVVRQATEQRKPVILLCGQWAGGWIAPSDGRVSVFTISTDPDRPDPFHDLRRTAHQLSRLIGPSPCEPH